MAFWSKTNHEVDIRKAMGRLLNSTFSVQSEYHELTDSEETRVERRAKRLMPAAVFLDEDSDKSIFIAFTRNLSIEGLGVISDCQIPLGDLIIVIGEPDERLVLRAECVHSKRVSFGCFESGLRIIEILRGSEYRPLLDYVASLDPVPV